MDFRGADEKSPVGSVSTPTRSKKADGPAKAVGAPVRPTRLVFSGADGFFGFFQTFAFRQQKAAQTAQIVQNAAAGGDVKVQFGEVIGDEKQGFLAAVGAIAVGGGDLGFHFATRLG